MEDNITNRVVTMAKALPRYDEKGKHAYRDWKARVQDHLRMSIPTMYDVPIGQEKPNPTLGGNLATRQSNNVNLHSVLFLATNG